MKNTTQMVMVFLLGVVVGVLLLNLIKLADIPTAMAATGPGESNNLIAVTGKISSGIDGLWVINSMVGKAGPSLCLYVPSSNGRGIRFAAARRIKYDIQLVQLNDMTKREYRVSRLARTIKKLNDEQEK